MDVGNMSVQAGRTDGWGTGGGGEGEGARLMLGRRYCLWGMFDGSVRVTSGVEYSTRTYICMFGALSKVSRELPEQYLISRRFRRRKDQMYTSKYSTCNQYFILNM